MIRELLVENYRDLYSEYSRARQILSSTNPEVFHIIRREEEHIAKSHGYEDPVAAFEYLVKNNLIHAYPPSKKNTYMWIKHFKEDPGGIDDFLLFLNAELTTLARSRQTKMREKDYDIVYKIGNVIVYRPNTKEAAIALGRGTRWCTSMKTQDYFRTYSDSGDLLYMFIKGVQGELGKIAIYKIHGYNDEADYYDSADRHLSQSQVANILLKVGSSPIVLFRKIGVRYTPPMMSRRRPLTPNVIEIDPNDMQDLDINWEPE